MENTWRHLNGSDLSILCVHLVTQSLYFFHVLIVIRGGGVLFYFILW